MNYEKIKAKVNASSLKADDKQTLNDLFATVDDESLSDIAKLFEEHPSWVEIFNDNREAKRRAHMSGDPNLWNQILEQEKKYISDLTFGLD